VFKAIILHLQLPGAFLGDLQAEYKKEDEMLDGKTASGIVAWSL